MQNIAFIFIINFCKSFCNTKFSVLQLLFYNITRDAYISLGCPIPGLSIDPAAFVHKIVFGNIFITSVALLIFVKML